MLRILSTGLENLTIVLTAYILLGRWDKTPWRWGGLLVLLIHIVIVFLWVFDISVWINCGIVIIEVCLFYRRNMRKAAYVGVIAYGGILLYLQAMLMVWIPMEWYPYLVVPGTGLFVNMAVCIFVLLGYGLSRKVDLNLSELVDNRACKIVGLLFSVIMMLLCQVYRQEVLETYRMITSAVTLLIMCAGLTAFCAYGVIHRKKTVRMEQLYQEELARRDRLQHDFEKWIRFAEEGMDFPMMKELKIEAEQQALMNALDINMRKVFEYYLQCGEEQRIQIQISSTSQVPAWRVSLKDSVTILGNLIENAMEAVRALPEEDRKIQIQLSGDGVNVLTIQNKFAGHPKNPHRVGHGYGISLACDAARKYGMELVTEESSSDFIVTIIK